MNSFFFKVTPVTVWLITAQPAQLKVMVRPFLSIQKTRHSHYTARLGLRRGPTGLSCGTHVPLASPLGAVPRHEAVISPVRVNLAAGELSRWLPADYSLVLCSSWLSPAEHDAGEKWTMDKPKSMLEGTGSR